MPSEDYQWVQQTLKGDCRAFDYLVEKYMNRAYWIAFRMVNDPQEVEDITQEAFFKAYRGLKGFRSESSFFTWFCRILVNLCQDHLRKKRFRSQFIHLFRKEDEEEKRAIEREVPDTHWSSNPNTVLEQNEFSRTVQGALSKLPIRQKTIFVLRHFQEMKIQEIAKTLEISEGTVKSHLFRAVRSIREELTQPDGGCP